jgi:hypothetical protein
MKSKPGLIELLLVKEFYKSHSMSFKLSHFESRAQSQSQPRVISLE